jgi:hypothetical protein
VADAMVSSQAFPEFSHPQPLDFFSRRIGDGRRRSILIFARPPAPDTAATKHMQARRGNPSRRACMVTRSAADVSYGRRAGAVALCGTGSEAKALTFASQARMSNTPWCQFRNLGYACRLSTTTAAAFVTAADTRQYA